MEQRVLIVEDDPTIRGLLEAVLRHEWIECVQAADGRAAMDLIRRESFAAILLDLLLPNVNGFELLRALKITDRPVLSRIIVLTAASESTWGGCEEIREVRCVIRKPIELVELIRQVRACFDAETEKRANATMRLPQIFSGNE